MKHKDSTTIFTWMIGLLLLINLPSAFGQTNVQSVLVGNVIDAATAKPIAKAEITLRLANLPLLRFETDKNGKFMIPVNGKTADGLSYQIEFGDRMALEPIMQVQAENYEPEINYSEIIKGIEKPLTIKLAKKIKWVTRSYKIQHRDVHLIAESLRPFVDGEAQITVSPMLNSIVVRQSEDGIFKIDSLVKVIDVPLKKFWVEVLVIRGAKTVDGKPTYPDEIASIAKQLAQLFKFNKYEIISRANALGLENSTIAFESANTAKLYGETETKIKYENKNVELEHRVPPGLIDPGSIKVSTQPEYHNGIIKLRDLYIEFQNLSGSNVHTSINLKNGETVILGASQGPQQDVVLISAVTAKTVE